MNSWRRSAGMVCKDVQKPMLVVAGETVDCTSVAPCEALIDACCRCV